MKKNEIPKYATLLYSVREELEISWAEYVYLDMVYHLSRDGWCYKSLDNTAKDLGLDRSSIFRMRKRLIEKMLLKKSIKGYVKTTDLYAKRIRTDTQPVAKRTIPYAKRDSGIGETRPKNNNRITRDKRNLGFSKNKERIRQALATGNWESFKS